jgi:hypothetical protein
MTPEELTKMKRHMTFWDPILVPVECQEAIQIAFDGFMEFSP